ncbi:MAG TPA: DnaB-like helicase C-terminal domain-containing protein [Acidimicrobiia bacterium]|nr:DnaB-like helicase C-terminal domain-containing protein [Acidimicrobiia bacterium]
MDGLDLDVNADSHHHDTRSSTAAALLDASGAGWQARDRRFATGFSPFDDEIGGGLHTQDLLVIGGRPGVGKTMATLQWARAMAFAGHSVVYVSYEHDERMMLGRLLRLEVHAVVGDAASDDDLHRIRQGADRVALGLPVGEGEENVLLQRAVARVRSYADRLLLVRASGYRTRLEDLDRLIRERDDDGDTVLFVDHLYKVPHGPDPLPESEHMALIAGGLKDLALTQDVGIVAIAPTNKAGLTAPRARIHHLRGAEAVAYEADIVVMMNEKATAVSKSHRSFDPVRAREFRRRVVFSIEKNRRGEAALDLDFEKDFSNARFHPGGAFVAERLVDEVFAEE